MKREERATLRADLEVAGAWVKRANAVTSWRTSTIRAAQDAAESLAHRAVAVARDESPTWNVIALSEDDIKVVRALEAAACVPPLSVEDTALLKSLREDVAKSIDDARQAVSFTRIFRGEGKRREAESVGEFISKFVRWGEPRDLEATFTRLLSPTAAISQPAASVAEILAPERGLASLLAKLGSAPYLVGHDQFRELPASSQTIQRAVQAEAQLRKAAHDAGEKVRNADVARLLAGMPVDELRKVTGGRLRVSPLVDAGIRTVGDVLRTNASRILALDGIGDKTAHKLVAAARTVEKMTRDEMPMRIDLEARSPEATHLLARLTEWDTKRTTHGARLDIETALELAPLAETIHRKHTHLLVLERHDGLPQFGEVISRVVQRSGLLGRRASDRPSDPWDAFIADPVAYYGMLAELGFATEDEASAFGGLPDDIVEAVRSFDLRTELLTASLRGYQAFAARFALVQKKVVVGDEMGLGKTVEALAVLAHLRAAGQEHFLVVCPAALVTNWTREVASKSSLTARRLHGNDRELALRNWVRAGGVGVTTYESLPWLERQRGLPQLAALVVDEAHYIKNPEAQRSIRTHRIIQSSPHAILLTGTPLENRVGEFKVLVGYVQPKLAVRATEFTPRQFRKEVAPAYLRRNQEDVLNELPDLIEVEEWLPLSPADQRLYVDAVHDGNFMAMRRAAFLAGTDSTKAQRLLEIVEEAELSGRKVVVFSFFLDVLSLAAKLLPGVVIGPLTGSVNPQKRQDMVDQLAAADHGAVLLAQIGAGGVGLNIQAASVVVICEPQFKPTAEAQAIARAHRMGQALSVQVHRLLSETLTDKRIAEILAKKRIVFDEFARVSDTAESAPEAFDISEADLAREVIAAEREVWLGGGRTDTEPPEPRAAAGEQSAKPTSLVTDDASTDHSAAEDPPRVRSDLPSAVQPGTAEVETPAWLSVEGPIDQINREATTASHTSSDETIARILEIVGREGPIAGSRLYERYAQSHGVLRTNRGFVSELNKAIYAALQQGLITDNSSADESRMAFRTYRLGGTQPDRSQEP